MQASPAASATCCSHAPLSAIGYRLCSLAGFTLLAEGFSPTAHNAGVTRRQCYALLACTAIGYRLCSLAGFTLLAEGFSPTAHNAGVTRRQCYVLLACHAIGYRLCSLAPSGHGSAVPQPGKKGGKK